MKSKITVRLEGLLNRFFQFYGIEKSNIPNTQISEIELREMMIKLAKTCYGLGLQESRELNKTFLSDK